MTLDSAAAPRSFSRRRAVLLADSWLVLVEEERRETSGCLAPLGITTDLKTKHQNFVFLVLWCLLFGACFLFPFVSFLFIRVAFIL